MVSKTVKKVGAKKPIIKKEATVVSKKGAVKNTSKLTKKVRPVIKKTKAIAKKVTNKVVDETKIVAEKISDSTSKVKTAIKENPKKSACIAVGVGAVLAGITGFLIRKKKK